MSILTYLNLRLLRRLTKRGKVRAVELDDGRPNSFLRRDGRLLSAAVASRPRLGLVVAAVTASSSSGVGGHSSLSETDLRGPLPPPPGSVDTITMSMVRSSSQEEERYGCKLQEQQALR